MYIYVYLLHLYKFNYVPCENDARLDGEGSPEDGCVSQNNGSIFSAPLEGLHLGALPWTPGGVLNGAIANLTQRATS